MENTTQKSSDIFTTPFSLSIPPHYVSKNSIQAILVKKGNTNLVQLKKV